MFSFFQLSFKPNCELTMQFDYEYHYKNSMFLYLFSIFDKLATLLFFHYYNGDDFFENSDEIFENKLRYVKFSKPESYFIFEGKNKNQNLEKEIYLVTKSNSFKYLSKIRNKTYHHFQHPILRYHLSITIMVCFITLSKLIDIIKTLIY